MRYTVLLFVLVCLAAPSAGAREWPQLQPRQVGTHTWVIEHGPHDEDPAVSHGFHNNPGFVVTESGVVVIDTGSSVEIGRMILRKIAAVTPKPVTHVFTTHVHGDHWLANQALVEAYPDVKTIAHPEAIAQLNAGEDRFWLDVFAERLGTDFAGTRAVIPTTAATAGTYRIGGLDFQLLLFDKAHTTTDLMVYVVEDGVLFTGDIVNNAHLSYMGHGDFAGAYQATQAALALQPRHVVAGHGRSGDRTLIEASARLYQTLPDIVAAWYEQGLLDFEIKPRVVAELADYRDWNGFDRQIGPYISQIIAELEAASF
jgi:glyoxylase-like metal-dependent hydrolase (beta-lactamase superfamily II)